MDFASYQAGAHETAVYPDDKALEYVTLGLIGEAGELGNKVKKLIRDGDSQEKRQQIAFELGDVLWYVSELCTVLETDLNEVAAANLRKLSERRLKGTLKGSGDNR